MPLPEFSVTGNLHEVLGPNLAGELLVSTPKARLTFTPNFKGPVVWDGELYWIKPVGVGVNSDGSISDDDNPVLLLANDGGLNVTGIQWTVEIRIQGAVTSWTFNAAADGQNVDLASVAHSPGVAAVSIPALTESTLLALINDPESTIHDAIEDNIGGTPDDGSVTVAKFNAASLVTAAETIGSNNNDTTIPTSAAVQAAIALAVTGLLDFKGATNASTNPNYPAASKGDAYVVSTAGKVGGASGKSVDTGDVYLATANNAGGTEASVGTNWSVLEHNLVGALLSANNLSDIGNAAAARANIGAVGPLSNRAVAIGDSITLGGDNASLPKQLNFAWLHNICIASNQRIQDAGLFATSGYTLEQIRTIHLPSVLAMNPLPGACFVLGGTNDILAAGTALSAMQTSVKAIVSTLRAAGITPILLTVTPSMPGDSTVTGKISKHNTWLLRYAAQNGISIVDAYRAVVDPVGGLKAAYDGGDHVHPNGYGHKAIAQQAMRDGLPNIFPVPGSMTVKSSIDLTNMLNNGTVSYGIFNVDTNSDGVGDGWTTANTGSGGTVSRVTPNASDELSGMWQQLSRTTGNTGDLFLQSQIILTGYSVGDVLALSYRVQTQEMESSVTWWACYAYFSGADQYMGCLTQYADEDGLVYVEYPVPSGTTQIQVNAQMNVVTGTGNPKLRIGEISLRNLTTNALLGV